MSVGLDIIMSTSLLLIILIFGLVSSVQGSSDETLESAAGVSDEFDDKPLVEHHIDMDRKLLEDDASAQNLLVSEGLKLLHGTGVKPDKAAAVMLFEQAAQAGSVHALSELGHCYYSGLGVEKNVSAADKYFSQSAPLGDPVTLNNLGNNHYYGNAITQNKSAATEYFRRAALQEDPHGLFNFGNS